MNYFERIFQEIRLQIQEQILYRTYALQKNHFWTKLALAGCGTFFSPFFAFDFYFYKQGYNLLKNPEKLLRNLS